MKFLVAIFLSIFLFLGGSITYAKGALEPSDLQYKGLYLGDSQLQMQELLGEPLFASEVIQGGVRVKCHTYSGDLKVYTSLQTDKVLEIFCRDRKYKAREGVTYGATRGRLEQVYGTGEHQRISGRIYFIYRREDSPNQKLMMEMESTDYYVISMTITSLPINEEELMSFSEVEWEEDWRKGEEGKFSYSKYRAE